MELHSSAAAAVVVVFNVSGKVKELKQRFKITSDCRRATAESSVLRPFPNYIVYLLCNIFFFFLIFFYDYYSMDIVFGFSPVAVHHRAIHTHVVNVAVACALSRDRRSDSRDVFHGYCNGFLFVARSGKPPRNYHFIRRKPPVWRVRSHNTRTRSTTLYKRPI